jgi:DNA-binding LacI/PurR family transcriptional regulator
VLNNSVSISSATREKVLQAVEELNYIPNQVARSLSTAISKQISVFIDNINNPYYGEIVSLFEKNAIEQGCFVNICTKPQYMDTYFTNILSRQIDGLMMMVVPNEEIADSLKSIVKRGIPVAASGFFAPTSGISLINPDFKTGMLQTVRYLADLGHSRIVYLSCFEHDCKYDTRVKFFEAACEEIFNADNQCRVFAPENENMISNEETGYRLTKRLIDGPHDFTAIITTGDLMAVGCMAALKDEGMEIPGDVSVMGIDGIAFGEHVRPSLTTLMLDKENLAQTALTALFKQRAGGGVTIAKTGFSICERQSVMRCK